MTKQNLPDVAAAAARTEFVTDSEIDFIARLQAGEAAAFDFLITKFSGELYGLLLRLTENAEEASDLTQETFLRVVQSVHNFRGEATVKTWLFRIAINQARNRRRWWTTRKVDQTVSLDSESSRGDGDDDEQSLSETIRDDAQKSPELVLLEREQSTALRRALQELPQNFREAVILRDIEGLSYEEIALALEIGVGTVKSRIARGRDELKKKLTRSL